VISGQPFAELISHSSYRRHRSLTTITVLDGLVVVDLRKTAPAVLERYMGREAAGRFRLRHGL
jgi:hypothetical protein